MRRGSCARPCMCLSVCLCLSNYQSPSVLSVFLNVFFSNAALKMHLVIVVVIVAAAAAAAAVVLFVNLLFVV